MQEKLIEIKAEDGAYYVPQSWIQLIKENKDKNYWEVWICSKEIPSALSILFVDPLIVTDFESVEWILQDIRAN